MALRVAFVGARLGGGWLQPRPPAATLQGIFLFRNIDGGLKDSAVVGSFRQSYFLLFASQVIYL